MTALLFAVVDAVLNARVLAVGEAKMPYMDFVPRFNVTMSNLGWWRSTWHSRT